MKCLSITSFGFIVTFILQLTKGESVAEGNKTHDLSLEEPSNKLGPEEIRNANASVSIIPSSPFLNLNEDFYNKTKGKMRIGRKLKIKGKSRRGLKKIPEGILALTPSSKSLIPSASAPSSQNANELRRKILAQLGAADPLLCLPKALCGISSKQSRNKKPSNSKDANGNRNDLDYGKLAVNEDAVEKYLQIMETVVPKSQWPTQKTLKSKKKAKKPIGRDDEDASSESNSSESVEDDLQEKPFTREDIKYFEEKAKIEKWMKEDDEDVEANWWDIFPEDKHRVYRPLDETPSEPPPEPVRLSKGLWDMLPLPSMSWGFGFAPDIFKNDPFFQEFRSFQGRSFPSNSEKGRGFLSSLFFGSKDTRNRNQNSLNISPEKERKRKRGRKVDKPDDKYEKLMNVSEDPAEKFQLAIELGKEMDDPAQCEFVFTGCPFTYQEVIGIIESSRKKDEKVETRQENSDSSSASESDSTSAGIDNTLEISVKVLNQNDEQILPTELMQLSTGTSYHRPTSAEEDHINSELIVPSPAPPTLKPTPSYDEFHVFPHPFPTNLAPYSRTTLSEQETDNHNLINPSPIMNASVTSVSSSETSGESVEKSVEKKVSKKKKKNKKRNKKRKQWGLRNKTLAVSAMTTPTPVINNKPLFNLLRESLSKLRPLTPAPQRINYKYKYKPVHVPLPLPTTINKPSHVINYHFHNTNTHPQLSASSHTHHGGKPEELTIHEYAKPPVKVISQPENKETTPTPLRNKSTRSSLNYEKESKRKRKRKMKKMKRKNKKGKKERIVIKLQDPTPSTNNNYYNLYPLLNSLYSLGLGKEVISSTSTTEKSQFLQTTPTPQLVQLVQQLPSYHHHQQHQQSLAVPPTPYQSYSPTFSYLPRPQPTPYHHQQYYSSPQSLMYSYQNPFSYFWGKKKK